MGWLSAIFAAIGSFFGWQAARSESANTPEMVANKEAAEDQTVTDKTTADLARNDLDAVREDLS